MGLNKKISIWLFLFLPILLYLIPYLSAKSSVAILVVLIPMGLIILVKLLNWDFKIGKDFISFLPLYLLILSYAIYFDRTTTLVKGILFITLILYLHSTVSMGNINLSHLNKLAKFFTGGIVLLLIFFIFVPLIIKYPFTPGAWYLAARPEDPMITTTLDGPFLLTVISAIIFLFYKYSSKLEPKSTKLFYGLVLLLIFYTLLVFNRRMLILLFFLFIPFVFLNFFPQRKIAVAILIAVFLIPVNFAIIINYIVEFTDNPFFQDLFMRTDDLNEENPRLVGWIKAFNAFRDFSFWGDFFNYRKELTRSTNMRYNHFHNGFIQMYYEQGIFGITLLLTLLGQVINRMKYLSASLYKKYPYISIFPAIFIIILSVSITESVFSGITITSIFFIVSTFFIINLTNYCKSNSIY